MILGERHHGTVPVEIQHGEEYLATITVPTTQRLATIGAYVDGGGPGAGPAIITSVVRDPDGELLITGRSVQIAQGDPGAWLDLRPEDNMGIELPAGDYQIGLFAGGVDRTARLLVHDPGDAGHLAQELLLPSPNLFPSPELLPTSEAPQTFDLPVFAVLFDPFEIPDVDDLQLARMPWQLSQRAFSATGPTADPSVAATCGWHGTDTDPERGAVALIRTDGPLSELVGERLRVTYRQGTLRRRVFVYAHTETAFPAELADEDLSLPRRAFLALAPWPSDSIDVSVEVLA